MKPAGFTSSLVGWLVLGVGAASPGLAADRADSNQHAESAAEADSQVLDFFLGRWQIDATNPGDGRTDKLHYEVQRFVGHAWLSGVGTSPDDPGFNTKDVWGRDPVSKDVIRTVFDSSGTYAIVRSPGWKNGTLVLEGDARSANGIVRVRETIRKISADEFHATWEAFADGVWRAYSIERVRRVLPSQADPAVPRHDDGRVSSLPAAGRSFQRSHR